MDLDDDEQFRMAIEASLAEHSNEHATRRSPSIVDLTEDEAVEEDEDARFERELQQALDASKQHAPPTIIESSSIAAQHSGPSSDIDPPAAASTPELGSEPSTRPASVFLSERAQLEQARLQRQKRHLEEAAARAGPSKRTRTVSPPSSPPESSPSVSPAIPKSRAVPTPNHGLFYDGDIRQTGNAHVRQDPNRPVFRMTDILSPTSDLEFVILSSYGADMAWLLQLIPLGIPVMLVCGPPDELRGRATIKLLGPEGWLGVMPRMVHRGVMHVKLMLLFYKSGRLRVVIPTANLLDYDWRDIENTVFLQDIPRVPSSATSSRPSHDFPTDLAAVMHLLNIPAGLTNFVNNGYPMLPLQSLAELQTKWDWSRVRAKVVASPCGTYEGWYEVRKWGHPRLGVVIRDIGGQPPRGKTLHLECQGSSVGNYTTQYLNEVYKSACGIDPISWIDTPKSRLNKQPWPPIQIIFPTLKTVDNTVYGRGGGGSFFCKKQYWNKAAAPKELFRDSKAKGGRVLMHTKMIVGTYKSTAHRLGMPKHEPPPITNGKGKGRAEAPIMVDSDTETETEDLATDDDEVEAVSLEGWVYVGSHNFTMAAWGSVGGSILGPKLNISNFELGVVLPIRDKAFMERIVPWEQPAPKYGKGDVPWMQEEHLNLDEPTWRQLATAD